MNNQPIIKTFIGAKAPIKIRNLINKLKQDLDFDKINMIWESFNNLHLTFQYLGPTLNSEIEKIGNELDKISKNTNKINLKINSTGIFPHIKRPSIYWLGVGGEIKKLDFFIKILSQNMINLGYPNQKNFYKPHITIGKSQISKKYYDCQDFINYKFEEIPFVIDKITIYHTTSNSKEMMYKSIKDFEFETSGKV